MSVEEGWEKVDAVSPPIDVQMTPIWHDIREDRITCWADKATAGGETME